MIYLTFNDLPSGIFQSQVIDKLDFWSKKYNQKVRLVCFISIKHFFSNKKKIKQLNHAAIVLPMFPRLKNWKLNAFLLFLLILFLNEKILIGRGVFACGLAILLKKRKSHLTVIYDGRGAFYEELTEYKIIKDETLLNEIKETEKKCVLNSDYNYAVSNALVKYWKEKFNYTSQNYSVIPCLPAKHFYKDINEKIIKNTREKLHVSETDILIIFSSGGGEWQSWHLLKDFFTYQKKQCSNLKLLILSKPNQTIKELQKEFPDSVLNFFVSPDEVVNFIMASDYGFLIREDSITNRVASPVKFAEYLMGGLQILISQRLGDYSDLVDKYNLGMVCSSVQHSIVWQRTSPEKKKQIRNTAEHYFSIDRFLNSGFQFKLN